MKRAHLTPLGAVMRGALAGAVGTLAMDLVWFARFKREGGEQRFVEWEFSTKPDWNEVSAPGQVGKRLAEAFLLRELPPAAAPLTNNVMHWGYGILWGVQYGLVAASRPKPRVRAGLVLGPQLLVLAALVVPHDAVSRVEDGLRGTVVLLQLQHLRLRIVLLELQNQPDISSSKCVD